MLVQVAVTDAAVPLAAGRSDTLYVYGPPEVGGVMPMLAPEGLVGSTLMTGCDGDGVTIDTGMEGVPGIPPGATGVTCMQPARTIPSFYHLFTNEAKSISHCIVRNMITTYQ